MGRSGLDQGGRGRGANTAGGMNLAGGMNTAGGAEGGPRGAWLRRCREGGAPSELAALLLSLEAKVRGLQRAEDVAEGRPWRRDHPYVGERARRYFPVPGGEGIAPYDGKIDGWLPPEADDPPLWHLQMVDGDDEELDEAEVLRYLVIIPASLPSYHP